MTMYKATKRMAGFAALAIALSMMISPARSQQPSAQSLATAKELVTATDSTAMFKPLIAGES